MAPAPLKPQWSVEYDTVRREKIFRQPPRDRTAYPRLAQAVRPHIDSFNAIFGPAKLLDAALKDIGTRTFLQPDTKDSVISDDESDGPRRRKNRLHLRINSVHLDTPELPASNKFSTRNRLIYPSECRERHATYRGRLRARLGFSVNDGEWHETTHDLGGLPIMLRSNHCHLEQLSPAELVHWKEEAEELGGYFIVNGNEKLIRLLIAVKRNYPLAVIRSSFEKRGPSYTKFGIQIRCVRPDETSQSNHLHYLADGQITFRFSWRKSEYIVPFLMIVKALVETNDREIYEAIVGPAGSEGCNKTYVTERVELLLRNYKAHKLHGMSKHRAYLGRKFKHVLDIPPDATNVEAGTELLRRLVLVHLGNVDVKPAQDRDKFDMLMFMVRKLYAFAAGDCTPDNPDAVSCQEVLLGGYLYGTVLKEKLETWIKTAQLSLMYHADNSPGMVSFTHPEFISKHLPKILQRTSDGVGGALEYFLSTGNLTSQSGLDLQQTSGFTIAAEKINFYRFISHFRMVHRGSFFAELKTTTVRKLLPESWGFLCPVHTPDGSPCGLLNHLAHECRIVTQAASVSSLPQLLSQLGVNAPPSASTDASVAVQLDGRLLGYCSPKLARVVADSLRYFKVEGTNGIPVELEIGYIPNSNGGLYPGIYLNSRPARLIRPVRYLPLDKTDYVGPFEQPFMSIACVEDEVKSGESTHVEIDVRHILSILANQTPFSDHNQSPRNMYQCQMAKQAMGTPGTALRYRTDNKAYQLQAGQTPIVRSPLYNEYGLDNFPNGTNAIVAVISYTGYDMDDAMILNKSASERGFSHGTIFKTKVVHIDEANKRLRAKTSAKMLFGFAPGSTVSERMRKHLDDDGLPHLGTMLVEGDVMCVSHAVAYDAATDTYRSTDARTVQHRYRDAEPAFVEAVRLLGSETGDMPCQAVSVKLRVPRAPVIGDKFSSRHGQKGVCSQKWPAVDMPFTESGMVPDVIINPHAFPSRMTIGMFVESLAGKAGALHGLAQDASPWRFRDATTTFSDTDVNAEIDHAAAPTTAADFFGEQLRLAGLNYHGAEPMYSGVDGRELAADIFVGAVFYQRLRHMVADKFQVRTTGPVAPRTGQPVKGRARGGGIRVGEMERDALLAHGTAFLLQDRLLNCSDYTRAWVCRKCGSFLSTQAVVLPGIRRQPRAGAVRCRRCAKKPPAGASKVDVWEDGAGNQWMGGEDTTVVAVPGVLRYLDVELSAMGVRMTFQVGP